jgi:MoxR-like ATPase
MRSSIGYPDAASTEQMLMDSQVRDRAAGLQPVATGADVLRMAELADRVHVDLAIVSYVRRLAEESRRLPDVRLGLSARGCLAWVRVAKAWALASGRAHVVPEDVTSLAHEVLGHRLLLQSEAMFSGVTTRDVVESLLERVPAPRDRGQPP